MKVLHVYASLRQRNGVTAVIMNYLRHMPKEDLQIALLVHSDSEPEMVSLARSLGAEVFFMPRLGLKTFRRFTAFLDAFFAGHPFDIVHSHFNQVDFALFPAARRHGVRHCISHSHNTKLSDYPLRALRNRLLCWNIARNADTLAACSEAAGEALFGKAFASDPRKLVVKNGVDIPRFSFDGQARAAIRGEFRVAPDEILLGHVGSFRPQKNHAFMLRLLERLLKQSDRFKLCFVGTGGLWEHVRKTAADMSLSGKIVFAGSRPDVPKILSAFDIFLLPSLFEGFGISLVEAQISGLPCLASSRVPREAAFTDLVRFLPLDRNGAPWVDAILDIRPGERTSRAAEAVAAGYDIAGAAKSLAEFYRRKTTDSEVRHGDKTRVLHILAALGSGGVDLLLYNFYMCMDRSRIAFDFIIHRPPGGMVETMLADEDSKVFHLPRFRRVVSNFFKTRAVIKQGRYQIVHVHHTTKSFVQLLAAWSCGVPVRIAHSHDAFIRHGFDRWRARFFGWLTTLLSNRQFACSDMAGRYVFGAATRSPAYRLLPNAIQIGRFAFDPARRREFRAGLGLPDEAFVLLHVGRFAEQKNHARLIRIFREVLKIRPEARLLLVGTGELEEEIRRRVAEADLGQAVVFAGESPDVPGYLQAADVFVLPSLHEGLGIVLIEAQTAGLPCFASKDVVPSAADVTGLVSFLPLEESDARWAEAICSADLSSRKNQVERVRKAGYDIDIEAPRLENWYLSGCPLAGAGTEKNHACNDIP